MYPKADVALVYGRLRSIFYTLRSSKFKVLIWLKVLRGIYGLYNKTASLSDN